MLGPERTRKLPIPCPMHLFYLAVSELYLLLKKKHTPISVIKVFFPSSVSYASQFSNGGGLKNPQICCKV